LAGATKQELIDWICPGDFNAKHAAINAKRVEGSGKWFIHHEVYKNWVSGQSPNLLYCPGIGTYRSLVDLLTMKPVLGKLS